MLDFGQLGLGWQHLVEVSRFQRAGLSILANPRAQSSTLSIRPRSRDAVSVFRADRLDALQYSPVSISAHGRLPNVG